MGHDKTREGMRLDDSSKVVQRECDAVVLNASNGERRSYAQFAAYRAYASVDEPAEADAIEAPVKGSAGRRMFGDFELPTLRRTDAEGSLEPVNSVPDTMRAHRRSQRRKALLGIGALVVLCLLSLLVNPGRGVFTPGEVLDCYGVWFSQAFTAIVAPFDTLTDVEILAQHVGYFDVINRAGVVVAVALCGAAAAVAGALVQLACHDRMATLPALGLSSAIELGDVVMVAVLGSVVTGWAALRWLACAVIAALFIAAMLRFSQKLLARKPNMHRKPQRRIVLSLAAALGFLIVFSAWDVLVGVPAGLRDAPNAGEWIVLILSCAVGFAPAIALRFRLNALVLPAEDVRQFGVDATRLRLVAFACAAALLIASQLQVGPLALFAIAAPLAARKLFGFEFRGCLLGSALIGAVSLTVCSIVAGFGISTSVVANVLAAVLVGVVLVFNDRSSRLSALAGGK